MNGGRERRRRYAIVLAISAALLAGLVVQAGPWQLAEQLAAADLALVSLALLMFLGTVALRALRWSLLLRAARHPVRGSVAVSQYTVAMALNDLTPVRVAGEGARIWGVNRIEGVPLGTGLATVMSEKVMDLVLITSTLAASVAALYIIVPFSSRGSLVIISSIVILVNLSIIALLRSPAAVQWGGRAGKRAARKLMNGRYAAEVDESVERTMHQFGLARRSCGGEDRRLVLLAAALTVPVWALEFARLTVIFASLGVLAPLPAVVISSSFSLTLQMFLPGGSGNVAAISDVFAGLGVTLATATAAGLLSVATSIWISVPIALAVLLRTGRGVTGPSREASDQRDDSPCPPPRGGR